MLFVWSINSVTMDNDRSKEQLHRSLRDLETRLHEQTGELETLRRMLEQQAAFANLGALAAGLAHDVNNPIAIVQSNLGSLSRYADKIMSYAAHVAHGEAALAGVQDAEVAAFFEITARLREELKLDFVLGDIKDLVRQSLDGMARLQGLVHHLRSFTRREETPRSINLNEIIDGVLIIMRNEFKYKATLEKEYGKLRAITGNPVKLAQLLLNILLNAAEAIEQHGQLWIRTRMEQDLVTVEIQHDGRCLPEAAVADACDPAYRDLGQDRMLALRLRRARCIAEDLGGQLRVAATTVSVDLPTS
jgi:two-component system NtrC family sensor kinase